MYDGPGEFNKLWDEQGKPRHERRLDRPESIWPFALRPSRGTTELPVDNAQKVADNRTISSLSFFKSSTIPSIVHIATSTHSIDREDPVLTIGP